MKDPTGEAPWEEDDSAQDVVHLPDPSVCILQKSLNSARKLMVIITHQSLAKLLRKEDKKPIMIMFYAPWCGFCKKMKPDYSAAAKEIKGEGILAAIDVNRPENSPVRKRYNITGFPTLIYFK